MANLFLKKFLGAVHSTASDWPMACDVTSGDVRNLPVL